MDRGFSEAELKASKLRKQFVQKYIVNFDVNLYQTQVERDWAYIARREYNYEVLGKAVSYGFFWGNLAWTARMYQIKRFTFWPLPVVWGLMTLYLKPIFFQRSNKRLFDMCNVGEQYTLGAKRNEILRECNRILDREDF